MLATDQPAPPGARRQSGRAGWPGIVDGQYWVVGIRGVHGGVGTTTVAAHLAGAWARWGLSLVGLIDLAGGLARRLDLPPGVRTWTGPAPLGGTRDADRLRQALPGALAEPWPGLQVLPLAGLVDGRLEPVPHPALVRAGAGGREAGVADGGG